MNCCGPAAPNDAPSLTCPTSGSGGVSVDRQTVKALLTEQALARLTSGDYRFCPDAACTVVYFNSAGHVFTTADVRVRVWHKERFGGRMICYCFGETEAAIAEEIRQHGRSAAVERVREHIKADHCACDIRNPRGACCLGDITRTVTAMEAALLGAAAGTGEP